MALGHNLRKMAAKSRRFFYHFLIPYHPLQGFASLFYKPCLPMKNKQTLVLANP
jgi:hypothetical protein